MHSSLVFFFCVKYYVWYNGWYMGSPSISMRWFRTVTPSVSTILETVFCDLRVSLFVTTVFQNIMFVWMKYQYTNGHYNAGRTGAR